MRLTKSLVYLMPENSKLKPCPFCEETECISAESRVGDIPYIEVLCTRCSATAVKENWQNRPGEDAARLKQFEEDCEAVCEYCEAGVVIELFGDVWVHADGISCAAFHLRSAWEERHV